MTNQIQQTRYDRLVRRLGGIIGPGSKVSEALSELFPVLELETLLAELAVLSGTALGHGNTARGGVAVLNQHSQVFNPADSGVIATVTYIAFSTDTTQNIVVGLVNALLADTADPERFRDGRLGLTPGTVCQVRTESIAASSNATRIRIVDDVTFVLQSENGLFVLPPGFGCQVGTTTQNTTLRVSYMWRERPAEQSELNF